MGRLMISLELQDQPFLSTISRRPTFCPERRRQGQLGGRPTSAQLSLGIAEVNHTLLFDSLAPPPTSTRLERPFIYTLDDRAVPEDFYP